MGASRLVSAGRGSTSPASVSGPPPLMLPGAALGSLAARFCSGRYPSAFRAPLPGAALGSLAAHFCWQGQHFRLWTVPERVSGPPLDAARRSTREPRGWFLLAGQHFSSGRYPSAFRGPPHLMLPGAALGSAPPSLMLPGGALQALDGARARFGAPPLDAARGSTSRFGAPPLMLPSVAGAALQTRARFGGPASTALGSLVACFCWQGQHFRLWTVPERVSGPPPLDAASLLLAGAALRRYPSAFRAPPLDAHLGASRLVSAGRGSTSGSGRYNSAFRAPLP